MGKERPDEVVPVAAATRRSWEVDDERAADDARDAAGEDPVWRLTKRIRAERLRDPRHGPLDQHLCRLGRDVARRDPGATRRQDHVGRGCELGDRRRDPVGLVRDDAALDAVPVGLQTPGEQVAARVLDDAARDAVGDREDARVQSFSFSMSSTVKDICLSTAFAMS